MSTTSCMSRPWSLAVAQRQSSARGRVNGSTASAKVLTAPFFPVQSFIPLSPTRFPSALLSIPPDLNLLVSRRLSPPSPSHSAHPTFSLHASGRSRHGLRPRSSPRVLLDTSRIDGVVVAGCGSRVASREIWISMVVRELFLGVVVDEPVVAQPLDGSALGSNITQVVPRRN